MPYDPSKDQLIWEAPTSPEGLIIQIRSYNGSDAKVKFMRTFTRRNSQTPETQPAYGITLEDIIYMGNFWGDISQHISAFRAQRNGQQQGGYQNQGGGYQQGGQQGGGFGGPPPQQQF